jgi:hypothetical protein
MPLDKTERFQTMPTLKTGSSTDSQDHPTKSTSEETSDAQCPPGEINGFKGPEPTRYGDWEKNGRCIDF